MVKGAGAVSGSNSSVIACRRRCENSQRKKSAIAPTNATIPTTIPAMAPAPRGFDRRGKVEVETALAAADSVRDIVLDREDGVDFKSEVDCDCELLVMFTVVDAQCVKELFPSAALIVSICSRDHV